MILLIAVIVVSLICAYTDFKYRKIFNKLTFPTIIIAAIYWLVFSGFNGLLTWGTGLLLGLVLLIFPFVLRGMGAGDVKMLAMIGALMGPIFVFKAFLWAAILGGGMALFYMMYLGATRKSYIPYGIPIALGVFIQIFMQEGII